MVEKVLKDSLNNTLHLCVWNKVLEPKGVVQILHGVNEHGQRYTEFAEFLNGQGYIVYITDHFAQGQSRTKDSGEFVNFTKRGHKILVDGMIQTKEIIKRDYPGLKIYALGHSLGSLIIRNYLIWNQNEYEKFIFTGAGLSSTNMMAPIQFVSGLMGLFKGKKPSNMFDNMFRQTQLRLQQKADIDHFIEWLTRDEEKNEINKKDPYLFIRLTVNSFTSLLRLVKRANNISLVRRHYKGTIEVLLLSGTHDPSTDFGNGTMKLNEFYCDIGVKSNAILYEEARHELLQETNRHEIFTDIIEFLNR